MRRRAIVSSSIFAICILAGAASASAQQRGFGWGMMGPGMMGRDWPPGPGGMMGMFGGCPMYGADGRASAFIDGRIAFLKAELGITDAQKNAWDAYADATKRNLQSMQTMWQSMRAVFEAQNPVERLDAHLAAIESRAKALKDVKPALAGLYDALGVEQKKKADEVLTGMGCMM